MPMPLEIVGLGRSEVRFVWDDDDVDVWPVRALRIDCTCALCQSEATGERILDPDAVPRDIVVTDMRLVGNYGVNIHFSDGHSTGIYRFAKLREVRPPLFAVRDDDVQAADDDAADAADDAADDRDDADATDNDAATDADATATAAAADATDGAATDDAATEPRG